MSENQYTWRIIPFMTERASWHMSVDHAILDNMERRIRDGGEVNPTFRVYKFSRPAVILGTLQNPDKINLEIAKKNGIEYTTRPTGGGAFYSTTEEIHTSVVAPLDLFPKDIIKRYLTINSSISDALKSVGVEAYEKRTSVRIGDDRRLYVSGQASKPLAMFHHGSLHVNFDVGFWKDLLKATDEENEKINSGKIALLSEFSNYREMADKLQDTLYDSFIKKFCPTNCRQGFLTDAESELAKKYQQETYDNHERMVKDATRKGGICQLEEFDWNKKDVRL